MRLARRRWEVGGLFGPGEQGWIPKQIDSTLKGEGRIDTVTPLESIEAKVSDEIKFFLVVVRRPGAKTPSTSAAAFR